MGRRADNFPLDLRLADLLLRVLIFEVRRIDVFLVLAALM